MARMQAESAPGLKVPTPAEIEMWSRAMIRSTPDFAVLFVDLRCSVGAWLGAAERLFGYTEAEAVGMPFQQLFTPEDVQRGLDQQEMALALAGGRSEDERWHRRKDGSRFWSSGVLHAVRDEAGNTLVLC